MSRQHHRPMIPGDRFFAALESGVDPGAVTEAAEVAAAVLVRGARAAGDDVTAQRVLTLADTEGMETLAELWSHDPAHTLAGCLWRLYLLRGWVHAGGGRRLGAAGPRRGTAHGRRRAAGDRAHRLR